MIQDQTNPSGPTARQLIRIAWIIAFMLPAFLVLLIPTTLWITYFREGMRPTISVQDYDPDLTREAETALPIIRALQRFRVDHQVFPAEVGTLAAYLPTNSCILGPSQLDAWVYTCSDDGSSYGLWHAVGWVPYPTPSLAYEFSDGQGHWIFHPGDGSGERAILLKP